MPADSFQDWIERPDVQAELDRKLGTPLTPDETSWAAEALAQVVAVGTDKAIIESTARGIVPDTDVRARVIGAYVGIPHPIQTVNASKVIAIRVFSPEERAAFGKVLTAHQAGNVLSADETEPVFVDIIPETFRKR